MTRFISLIAVLGITLPQLCYAREKPEIAWSVAASFWQMTLEDDRYDGRGLLYGASATMDFSNNLWFSTRFLTGERNWDVPYQWDYSLTIVESAFGFALKWMDIGCGFRYWKDRGDYGVTLDHYGPFLYAGTGASFPNSSLAWYAGASIAPINFNDDVRQDREHLNVEAGLSYSSGYIFAILGYRLSEFYKSDNSLRYYGPTVSIGLRL